MPLVSANSSRQVQSLLAPISTAQPAGLFDIEDETYQAIDQEMVKLGGLRQGSIDWLYIEEAAQQYLLGQAKQFRVAAHLLTAWLQYRQWARWSDAICLLAGMVAEYWETSHPKPGATGYPAKRKLVKLSLKRLAEALPRLEAGSFEAVFFEAAQRGVARLVELASAYQLDLAALLELQRALLRLGLAGAAEPVTPPPLAAPSSSLDALTRTLVPAAPKASLGNERETRRALLNMADFVNQQDPYDPTGYQLRRFALWAHLHAAPGTREGRRTELPSVPADISALYQDGLSGANVEPALLMRVEKSVAASPYWIRGSFYAAAIATRLAMTEVAEGIRQATERFARRLPALRGLCFSDGSPFIDDQCYGWLAGGLRSAPAVGGAQEFGALREELHAQLDNEGVEVVLLRLQKLHAEYQSPREHCHAALIASELLASRGLTWLARDLSAAVARTMEATTAKAWEPDLYQSLQGASAQSARLDQ